MKQEKAFEESNHRSMSWGTCHGANDNEAPGYPEVPCSHTAFQTTFGGLARNIKKQLDGKQPNRETEPEKNGLDRHQHFLNSKCSEKTEATSTGFEGKYFDRNIILS